MADSTIAKLFVELGFNDQEFQAGVKQAGSSLQRLGAAGNQLSSMFGGVVTKAFQAATLAASGFAAATAVVGSQFEQEIATVGAVSGATREEMEALTEQARTLGKDTTFSATEAASAMQELARAGMTSNEVIAASGPALLLAGAAGADMSLATASMSATLAQFSLDAGESSRVADVFSTALRSSLFDLSSLTEAMKYAGTVGAGFGMTLEETVASVAQFRNLGLEGSMAGTQFRMAMSAAANVTEKGQKVLEKYGITQAQINPEIHNFRDILETVGASGMSAADAIQVFGKRSGANVALLARQFQEGSSTYDELLVKLETSTGSTQAMYEEMTNTVMAQFTILGSATQELMLSVFDTYKGPLLDLLRTLSDVVNYVAQEFQRRTGEVAGNATNLLRSIQATVSANRAAIADTFIALAEGITRAIQLLVQFAPILDELFVAMVAVFAVGQILSFIATLGAAVQALFTVGEAVMALTAVVSASTGGIYLLVVAIGVLVTGLVALATQYGVAQQKAEEFQAAQDGRAAREAENARKYQEGVDAMVASTQDWARTREQDLTLSGELSEAYARNLQALQSMTAEQLAAGEANGELVRVTRDGVEVFATMAMVQEESANAALGGADAMDTVVRRQRDLRRVVEESSTALEEGEALLVEYREAVDQYGEGIAAGVLGAREFANESELQVYLEEIRAKGEKAADTLEKLSGNLTKVRHEAEQTTILDELADAEEREAEAARKAAERQKQYAQALQAATTAREKAAQAAEDLLADTLATEEQALQIAMQDREAEIVQAFSTEIGLRRGNAAKVAELEAAREEALAQVRMSYRLQAERNTTAAHTREVQALQALSATEAQVRQSARDQELADLQAQFQAEALLYADGSRELVDVRLREVQAVSVVLQRHRAEDRARVAQYQDKVDQITESGASSRVDRLEAIEREGQRVLLSMEDATAAQRAQVAEHFRDRRVAEEEKIRRDVLAATNSRAGAVIRLEDELAARLLEIPESMGEERAAITEHYEAQIREARGTTLERLQEAPPVQKFTKAMEVMVGAVKGVATAVGGIRDAFGGVMDGLEAVTGFSFSLTSAVSDITSTMADADAQRAELEASFRAGDLTAQEYRAAMAELPASAAEAAGDYVTELVGGAVSMVSTFVEAAPVLLQELAAQIPTLLSALAEALPQVLTSLAEAIPLVVESVLAELPRIVQALADSIPVLVQTIVDQLPQIIQKLGEVAPVLIQGLAEGVAVLIQAVPEIVQALLEQVPAILEALVQAIDTIVVALVEAIPALIQVVIDQLPALVVALVEAVLGLVAILAEQIPLLLAAVVELIPDLIFTLLGEVLPGLITAVVGAIPTIVVALISSIPALIQAVVLLAPQIVTSVVKALPLLITALVNAIPDLMGILIPALIETIPTLLYALAVQLPIALFDAIKEMARMIADAVWSGLQRMVQFFRDVIKEIVSLGTKKTDTFGDTPGPVFAGNKPYTATFSPGDYVIAAREPANLLRQAMSLMGQGGLEPGAMEIPSVSGLAQAILQSGSASVPGPGGAGQGGPGGPLQVTVTAEGRTLDEVLYLGAKRGGTPRLSSMMKRATAGGVHVGLTRGRYSPSS